MPIDLLLLHIFGRPREEGSLMWMHSSCAIRPSIGGGAIIGGVLPREKCLKQECSQQHRYHAQAHELQQTRQIPPHRRFLQNAKEKNEMPEC